MDKLLQLLDIVYQGVNVDNSDLHMDSGEARQAQNVISDPKGEEYALVNREGLGRFNALTAAGSVLGGVCVPLPDELTDTGSGESHLYIGVDDAP